MLASWMFLEDEQHQPELFVCSFVVVFGSLVLLDCWILFSTSTIQYFGSEVREATGTYRYVPLRTSRTGLLYSSTYELCYLLFTVYCTCCIVQDGTRQSTGNQQSILLRYRYVPYVLSSYGSRVKAVTSILSILIKDPEHLLRASMRVI